MKTVFGAVLTALLAVSLSAHAEEPVELNETQLDQITAGVGANNRAIKPWKALGSAPQSFSLNHLYAADHNNSDKLMGVAVPSAVPNSACIALCP